MGMTTPSDPRSRATAPAADSPLARAEAAALPTIRAEAPDDIDAISELHRAAFGGPNEAALVDAIRRTTRFIPDLSLVAELNGQVIGHLLLSQVELAPADGSEAIPALALAPLAVLPMHQGRGVGTLLVRGGMALADARGREALVAVLGAPAFYRRFGFESAATWTIDGPWASAADAFAVRPVANASPVPGTVIYPPAFTLV